jgi:polygalacturonase
VTLQDFSVSSPQTYGTIQIASNTTLLRGTITGRGGVTGYRVQNVLIDQVTFNVTVGAIGIYDQGEGCENLAVKRTRGIVLKNSDVRNTSLASETAWFKCSQDVQILNNRFRTTSEWSLSFPDALDVEIARNSFDLSSEPKNWLGIELPRTFRVRIEDNTFTGPSGDWGVWLNSGSDQISYAGNTVSGGMGLVCCTLTPPSTGDGGLRVLPY